MIHIARDVRRALLASSVAQAGAREGQDGGTDAKVSLEERRSQYQDRADEIAREFGPGHHGAENLAARIVEEIRFWANRRLEWAAVATDELRHTYDQGGPVDVPRALEALAISFRERAKEP